MEFCEKLQELRKNRGLTQEELAQALFVSRTAVSKWESGRGYPSIISLKEISEYFSVTIDDLLSSEKLVSIAQKENRANIRNICDMFYGIADLFSVMFVVLPLYPKTVDGFIYAVSLLSYTETTQFNLYVYWVMFSMLICCGVLKLWLTWHKTLKGQKMLTALSMYIGTIRVLYLSFAREAYAVTVAFVLLMVKMMLIFKSEKASR